MTISDLLVIAAIIIAPVLAIQIQKFIERRQERKLHKLQIFRTLMASRATPLSPYHVEALNRIDIEFYDNKKIKDAWKLLLDNFANYPTDTNALDFATKINAAAEKSNDLLVDLLYEMARYLGYDFDKVHLKRGAYIPRGHAEIESDQYVIRKKFVEAMSGKGAIPIKIINMDGSGKEIINK